MNKYLLAVLAFSVLSIYSLLSPGLPPTHDGEYHVMRFQQFYKVLGEGNLYPRWAPDFNNGYGIPLFNYVYPLPNYIASFFHFLGFSFIDSFKLNMIVASLLGGVFMFLWSRKYWGDVGGLVSSVFYTFSPYHFLDIYVRGSVGEVWALALFPGLLWSFYSFCQTKQKNFLVTSVIFLFLLIMSHNILASVFFSFFAMYGFFIIYYSKDKREIFSYLLTTILLGFGLSAVFWLPAILEAKYVTGLEIFNPTRHFPKLYQLIYSSWGYGFSGIDASGQMSFQIGIANLIAVFTGVILFLKTRNREMLFFLLMFGFFLFLITPFSSLIWKSVPLSSFVQFPWRLLSVLILISSFLAGGLIWDKIYKSKKTQIIAALLLIVLSVGLGIKYAKAPFHHLRSDKYYLTRANFTDGTNSPGNAFNTIWFDAGLKKPESRLLAKFSETKIEIAENKSSSIKVNVEAIKTDELTANIAYFPGWSVYVNGKKSNIEVTDKGLFEFEVPAGTSLIEVKFEDTTARKFSKTVSLISFVVLLGLFIKGKSFRIRR